jgi:signal transduction histidine kinase
LNSEKKTKDLERAVNDLKIKNQSLEEFARVAAHDIKSPVNNILSLSQFIIEDEKDLSVQGAELISMIGSSATDLGQLIDGILDLSRSSNLLDEEKNWLDLSDFTEGILNMLGVYSKMEVKMDLSSQNIITNKIALEQIMINIIAISLKYNTSSEPLLAISISEKDNKIEFCIEDNGPGISIKDQERIFTIFQTTDNESRDGISGTGIGLATVKSLVEGLGGTIRVKSQLGMGAAFIFTTEKH